MIDLNLIMRTNKRLHNIFLEVGQLRDGMYKSFIERMTDQGHMREPIAKDEYDNLVELIRIIGDYWLSSSEICNEKMGKEAAIQHASRIFMNLFHPYFTAKGRKAFAQLMGGQGERS